MELLQLRYFLVAAQYQHMTKAAEHLQIAQPALSQAIHRLEAELGVPLFERKNRSIELNDEGKSIILCSHDMYEVDKICDSINIIDSGKVVANNTPQGLKDQLLKTKEETNKNIRSMILKLEEEGTKGNEEKINHLRASLTDENEKVTVMVSNITDEMVEAVRDLEVVTDAKHVGNGRLNIDLKRSETSVNHVITAILSNGGNIASIKTNDPTLEDVFVAITAKQRTEIKNGRN